jgi:hypothetical protein
MASGLSYQQIFSSHKMKRMGWKQPILFVRVFQTLFYCDGHQTFYPGLVGLIGHCSVVDTWIGRIKSN